MNPFARGFTCDNLPDIGGWCVDGFLTTLEVSDAGDDGERCFTYTGTSPEQGVCLGQTPSKDCTHHDQCDTKCSRECAIDDFKDLSHLAMPLAAAVGVDSCVIITGSNLDLDDIDKNFCFVNEGAEEVLVLGDGYKKKKRGQERCLTQECPLPSTPTK